MKHLLKLMDLSGKEIVGLLDMADKLKHQQKKGIKHKLLKGKTLGMIFEKSSTRTRVSFEVGMYQLGGSALFLSSNDLQIGRGEPIEDTARVLSRYLDGIMIRTYGQDVVEKLAEHGSIPIINGLTDFAHPCQVLADLMTIREYKGKLKGLKIAYVGDGNNMCHSIIVGGLKVGSKVSVACPRGYTPNEVITDFTKEYADAYTFSSNPSEAVAGADVIITDVFTSMGQESETSQRLSAFAGYQVNSELLSHAKNDAIVLHCLPAHREEEISTEVFDKFSKIIFDEAENRLHAQKAVLVSLMGGK